MKTRNETLFELSQQVIPGGVNSPVRAMRAVGLDEPFFVERGEGAFLYDVEGARYLDWVLSWGPLIFGHADPETVEAVREAANGLSWCTTGRTTAALLKQSYLRSNCATGEFRHEATMTAIRLREALLARSIVKFEGCYLITLTPCS
jgi:glutamate-1-semialdehyde 2,1-aminomutase